VTIENNKARPVNYVMKKHTGRGATLSSSTMLISGIIIFLFLIYHLKNLKYGPHYSVVYDGIEMRDLYKLMMEYFSKPVNVFLYEASMILLGMHLNHGFWSAFQSLGFNHPRYNNGLKAFSTLFALVIALGYMSLPIYCYLQGAKT
jgi:succinate dehydrogenase / fumarate reductase cytochrome b subunit